jgi:hypothetical protein
MLFKRKKSQYFKSKNIIVLISIPALNYRNYYLNNKVINKYLKKSDKCENKYKQLLKLQYHLLTHIDYPIIR